jgi:hypothetical protein
LFCFEECRILGRYAVYDVSEERIASIIRLTRTCELATTLMVASNQSTLRLLDTADVPSPPILVTLMIEMLSSYETSFLQKPHGVISQKTALFIFPGVKTSNLTLFCFFFLDRSV